MSTGLEVEVRNRQRARRVDVVRLRRLTETLLRRELGIQQGCLGVQLIGAGAMAKLNWQWLQHEGSTDILTFDHRNSPDEPLHGELFICVDDAVVQAVRFATSPSRELVRYVIHGVLHLLGFDDLEPVARRRMKREENRLVRRMLATDERAGMLVRPVSCSADHRPGVVGAGHRPVSGVVQLVRPSGSGTAPRKRGPG